MPFTIKEVTIMFEWEPLGLDEPRPPITWKFCADTKDFEQLKYRILVRNTDTNEIAWDSGMVDSDCSTGVLYDGEPLQARTGYDVTVEAWDQEGGHATGETRFETGLMDSGISAWNGAQWIGAPEYNVCGENIGVFRIESRVRIAEGGTRAGIVFGANDPRLSNCERNEMLIEGVNFIRYEINVSQPETALDIYRVGYCAADREDKPIESIPLPMVTETNKYDGHFLAVEVTGNCACAYLDGVLVDSETDESPIFGTTMRGRQLNPLGTNDITTYPRLCDVGYYTAAGTSAAFSGIRLYNIREPKNCFLALDEDGVILDGGADGRLVTRQTDRHAIPMLRCEFGVPKRLKRARLYATARGIYECRINGQRVSDEFFAPGASQYDKHLLYQTYDVMDLLTEGGNAVAFTLASGWWSDAQTYVVQNYNFWGDRPALLAQIILTYDDGSEEIIATDTAKWRYFGEGPVRYASFFQGERLDARLKTPGFSKAGFCDERMKTPERITPCQIPASQTMPIGNPWPADNETEPELVGSINAPVRIVEKLTAKHMTEPAKGVYIYDLGQEIAGVPILRLHGARGTQVRVRYGEMLYPQLPRYGELAGRLLQANLRDASSTDVYMLCGDPGGETFMPRFTFHGYRYIEITGLDAAPALDEVQSVQLSSIPRITAALDTDNALVNRLFLNVEYSMLCNFISIPTDCPQRNERLGWAGDAHVFCRTALYLSDTRAFYYRYLQALADLQSEDGKLPEIAPVGGGFGGITYGCAMAFIIWELYQHYADEEIIRAYYLPMKRYAEYVCALGLPGEVLVGPIDDWLAPERTDSYLVWNAFYYRLNVLMASYARLLGSADDAAVFTARAGETRRYWNETFVDPQTHRTRDMKGGINDTQGGYALGLAYDVFGKESRNSAFAHLARKVRQANHIVQTGFFGTMWLTPMLSEGGFAEDAYQMLTQTGFPGWLYPVMQGATTIWERWDGYTHENGFGENNTMNSFNHYSFGSVMNWFYEYALGIRRDEQHPGYRGFILKPSFYGFTRISGGIETPYGRIESGYECVDGTIAYHCTVPPNTQAQLSLPGRMETLGSGSYTFRVPVQQDL